MNKGDGIKEGKNMRMRFLFLVFFFLSAGALHAADDAALRKVREEIERLPPGVFGDGKILICRSDAGHLAYFVADTTEVAAVRGVSEVEARERIQCAKQKLTAQLQATHADEREKLDAQLRGARSLPGFFMHKKGIPLCIGVALLYIGYQKGAFAWVRRCEPQLEKMMRIGARKIKWYHIAAAR